MKNNYKGCIMLPKLKNAYERIEELCRIRATEIYGKELPGIVSRRLDWELDGIKKNNFASRYLIAMKLIEAMSKKGCMTGMRGNIGASFVAFLLNITQCNPLAPHYVCPECHHSEFYTDEMCGIDMEDKVCPACGAKLGKDGFNIPAETLFGPDGDKISRFVIDFDTEDNAVEEINALRKTYSSADLNNFEILHHNGLLLPIERLHELTGVDPKDILFNDKQTMNFIASGKASCLDQRIKEIIKAVPPAKFDDLIRIYSLRHSTDAWENNGEELLKRADVELSDLICFIDDIMIFLTQRGMDTKTAFNIMKCVWIGKASRGGMPEEFARAISELPDIPDWYISSCEKIKYLWEKAHCVMYVKLMFYYTYYEVHFPDEFNCVNQEQRMRD